MEDNHFFSIPGFWGWWTAPPLLGWCWSCMERGSLSGWPSGPRNCWNQTEAMWSESLWNKNKVKLSCRHQEVEEKRGEGMRGGESRLPINRILASCGLSNCIAAIWPWQKALISSILVISSSRGGRYCFSSKLENIQTVSSDNRANMRLTIYKMLKNKIK